MLRRDILRKSTKMVVNVALMMGMLTGGFMKGFVIHKPEVLRIETGKVIDIEYSEDIEKFDVLKFEIDGHIYEIEDLAEDMFVGDNIQVTIDTKGTENRKDDVIKDWRYCW